jgi:DNA-binding transcriptional ArsR family regulator
MDELETRILLDFFKTVGQGERLKILGMLANRPHTAAELAELLGVKGTDAIHHLRKLQAAGLVTWDRRSDTYQLSDSALEQLTDAALQRTPTPQDEAERVLTQYLQGRRLQQIPANPDERGVILRWLADQFEVGRRYSEPRVNEIISRHYHKQETLRRYLLDSRLLKRAGSIYWRPGE